MKKQTLLLIAGSMMTFAACNNNANQAGPSQEQIDSIVNVRVAELQVAMAAHNDSMINALAQAKADSMMAAMHGTAAPATHAAAPRKAAPAPKKEEAAPAKTGTSVMDRKDNTQKQGTSVMDRKDNAQKQKQGTSVMDRK